jgi:RNA polymerase sigma-70 factor (ECF subfamily)
MIASRNAASGVRQHFDGPLVILLGEPDRGETHGPAPTKVRTVAKDGGERLLAEEPDLIRDAQKGDRPAFAVLVDRYWDRLYRWLYHLTRDGHAAEDLAQETFMKAFAAIGRFKAGTNFRAWLFRIGHNNFVNLHRSRAGQRQPLQADAPSNQEGPVDETLSREALEHLARAVSNLPTEFRAAFLLRVEEGLSFRSMAAILGTTEETARWRVFKARKKLLQTLSPELFPPSFRPKPEAMKEDSELEGTG